MTTTDAPAGELQCSPASAEDTRLLVEQIKAGDAVGLEALYKKFQKGIRWRLVREVGPNDCEEALHDAFLAVVKSIQAGGLDEPERLPGFIRTIVSRQIALRIGNQIAARERKELPLEDQASGRTDFRDCDARSPEKQAIDAQHVGVMRQMLNDLEPREREILTRFYFNEQTKEQIMREMGLNETQFRLFKSRTKQKFIGQVKDRLAFVTLFRVTETD